MTFRDDHDAALARADALEEEVRRLKEENERLKSPPPPPEPVPLPEPPRPASPAPATSLAPDYTRRVGTPMFLKIVAGVFAAIGFVLVVLLVIWLEPEDPTVKRNEAIRARNAHRQRWKALVWVEPCLRGAENDLRWGMRYTPDKFDPRSTDAYWVDMRSQADRLGGRCMHEAFGPVGDPTLSIEARRALAQWGAADAQLRAAAKPLAEYYGERDWVEDDFAGAAALWRTVEERLESWMAAAAAVERAALPQLRAEIGELAAVHEQAKGRDVTWWRIQVGLLIWDLLADCHAAMRDSQRGAPIDVAQLAAACRAPAERVIAFGKDAPLEVRRDLRDLSPYLEPLAAGMLLGDPAETLSHLQYTPRDLILSIDGDAIPGIPPEP